VSKDHRAASVEMSFISTRVSLALVGSPLVGKGRVIRPKSAQETDALRFDSKLVVNGVAQLLFTTEVALCRLNGHVAK
jgi:hypothetical protein